MRAPARSLSFGHTISVCDGESESVCARAHTHGLVVRLARPELRHTRRAPAQSSAARHQVCGTRNAPRCDHPLRPPQRANRCAPHAPHGHAADTAPPPGHARPLCRCAQPSPAARHSMMPAPPPRSRTRGCVAALCESWHVPHGCVRAAHGRDRGGVYACRGNTQYVLAQHSRYHPQTSDTKSEHV